MFLILKFLKVMSIATLTPLSPLYLIAQSIATSIHPF
jgi:hypothetical protein